MILPATRSTLFPYTTLFRSRDSTIKIDIPYITRLNEEVKIYKKDYNAERIRGKHIAPHTLEIAAMWGILTRLRSEEHTSELQSLRHLVCRLLLEKKKEKKQH